jgi:hypothetical protein
MILVAHGEPMFVVWQVELSAASDVCAHNNIIIIVVGLSMIWQYHFITILYENHTTL